MSTKAKRSRGGLSSAWWRILQLFTCAASCVSWDHHHPIFWRWPDHNTVPLSATHPLKHGPSPLQSYFVVLEHAPLSLQRYPLQRLSCVSEPYFRRPWSLWRVAVSSITHAKGWGFQILEPLEPGGVTGDLVAFPNRFPGNQPRDLYTSEEQVDAGTFSLLLSPLSYNF